MVLDTEFDFLKFINNMNVRTILLSLKFFFLSFNWKLIIILLVIIEETN